MRALPTRIVALRLIAVAQLTDSISYGGCIGNVFAKMEAKSTSPGRAGKDALVREIFEEIDEDGSGFLEFTEIGDLLDRLGLRINDDEVSCPRGFGGCALPIRAFLLVACSRKVLRRQSPSSCIARDAACCANMVGGQMCGRDGARVGNS